MNWADYVILAIALLSVLIGFMRGFAREVFGVLGWVLAFWVAFTFTHWGSAQLASHLSTPSVRNAAAFGGLFLGTLLAASLVTWLAGRFVEKSGFTSVDRTLGAGFGLLRALVVVAALLLAAGSTSVRQDPWWNQSAFIPHLEWMADTLRAVVPERWITAISSPSSEPSTASPPSSKPKGTS